MAQRRRSGHSARSRPDQLQRMDRRAGRVAPPRMRRAAEGDLGAGRRRRRLQAVAQHPDGEDDGRRVHRLRAERRADAPRAGLSDASVPARLGRQQQRQVAAAAEGDGPPVDGARRDVEVHGPARRRDRPPAGPPRQFTFDMEPKSLITRPSGGDALPGAGSYQLTGLAWSGRGAIANVEVTVDGGATWQPATLQTPVLPRAHTRFHFAWRWDGGETRIASRCTDDTGYTQPPVADLVAVRGFNSNYHNNSIQVWKIAADGKITNGNRA